MPVKPCFLTAAHPIPPQVEGNIFPAVNGLLDRPATIEEMAEAYMRVTRHENAEGLYHFDATPMAMYADAERKPQRRAGLQKQLSRDYDDFFLDATVNKIVIGLRLMRGEDPIDSHGRPVLAHVSSRYMPEPPLFGR